MSTSLMQTMNKTFNDQQPDLDRDWKMIEALGGPAKVARLLNFSMDTGVQRVYNWKTRGIPAYIRVRRPDLFMVSMTPSEGASASAGAVKS